MNLINNMLYWKLAIFKYTSGVLKVGAMAFIAGTVQMHLDPRVLVGISAAVAMLTFTEGFLDQVVSRLQAGKPPIGTNGGNGGHTEFITKTSIPVELTTKQTTTAAVPPQQLTKENEKTTASSTTVLPKPSPGV